MTEPCRTGPDRERYRLLIEVRADDCTAVITLRRFLKLAWRAFGVKCVAAEAVPADHTPDERTDR